MPACKICLVERPVMSFPARITLPPSTFVAAEDGADEFRAARADDARNAEDFARIQVVNAE